jgi:phosphoglucosamine mutase
MHSSTKHSKPQRLFGTDGIRGRAGSFPLDRETVIMIGRSLAKHLSKELGRVPRIVTGRDTRESGDWIEQAFVEGVLAESGEVEAAGVITTPGVAFAARHFGFDAGVVISASHNPYQDNGIKIFAPSGKKIDGKIEFAIEQDILNHASSWPGGETIELVESPAAAVDEKFREAYIAELFNLFKDLELGGLTIAVDCANGAASGIAPQLFEKLRAEVIRLSAEPNGRNINENCGSLYLDQLASYVTENKVSLGIAFDGDADRALFVDENGEIVDGDAVMWITAKQLQRKGGLKNRTVVGTVMSNLGLEKALESIDAKLVRTDVGDKYVLTELMRSGSELGGEQSGHIIFPGISLVGDGIMTALFVLRAMDESGLPLSKLTEGFQRFPQVLVNVPVREKKPFDKVETIANAKKKVEAELDGTGRLLLRYSGTENLARVMIEGKDQAQIESLANELADSIRNELG